MKFLQTASVFGLSLQAVLAQVQAPALPGKGAPISASDRIYTGDQSSNTITVIAPLTGEVLGTIALGDLRLTDVMGPQYLQTVNSHGLGFSRDGKYIVSLSVTTNQVTVIRCEDNTIQSKTWVDRQSHEAFFSTDNRTVWVGTRGVDYIDIVDGINGGIIGRVESLGGPSKVLFSPDGKTAYANHIRNATVSVIDVERQVVKYTITGLADTFSSDMMLSADGLRLWVSHKMVGKVSVISTAQRKVIGVLDTGRETNHPNFATVNGIVYGFTTVGALNLTRVYSQPDPNQMPVYVRDLHSNGIEPHGIWGSPDNTHIYVVNEHSDTVDFFSLDSWSIVKTVKVGQEGQALVYVADAVTSGNGTQNLGTQGLLSELPYNKLVNIQSSNSSYTNATALITVRHEAGLDMFQVIGRDLKLNTTYTASASCLGCNGAQVPLVNFTASSSGGMGMDCGVAPQVLAFFSFFGVYDENTLQVTEA
jgi:DNA-binding beta-propeller fold protein YncE